MKEDFSAITSRVSESASRLADAARVSIERLTVTGSVKDKTEQVGETRDFRPRAGLGKAWGRAVHRVIEGMGRGRTGHSLEGFIRAVAKDEALTEDETLRLARIPDYIDRLPVWKRLMAGGSAEFELTVMRCEEKEGKRLLIEGVIDAVGGIDDGMVVVDWKTDDVDDSEWNSRSAAYERQIGAYRDILSALARGRVETMLERVRLS